MTPRKPGKPDPEKLLEEFRAAGEQIFNEKALPYLHTLLDTAQAKTQYMLYLETGMGAQSLDVSGSLCVTGSWDTAHEAADAVGRPDCVVGEKVQRFRKKFPELVTFLNVVGDLHEIVSGDIHPTVPPRAADGSLDPVDYVERGPRKKCATRACKVVGFPDWDFVRLDGRDYCPACVNKVSEKLGVQV